MELFYVFHKSLNLYMKYMIDYTNMDEIKAPQPLWLFNAYLSYGNMRVQSLMSGLRWLIFPMKLAKGNNTKRRKYK